MQNINRETENEASAKNKAGSNTVTTNSDTKSNIPGGLSFTITFCIARIALTKELNRADCGYRVHRTERKMNHLLYMDDWKLLGRIEDNLENEICIAKAIIKHINIKSGLEKCARTCLKKNGRFQGEKTRKKHV